MLKRGKRNLVLGIEFLSLILFHVSSTEGFSVVQKQFSLRSFTHKSDFRTNNPQYSRDSLVTCFNSTNRRPISRSISRSIPSLQSTSENNDRDFRTGYPAFNAKDTLTVIGGQSLLILVAIITAIIFRVPNYSFGTGFELSKTPLLYGVLTSVPLFALAALLNFGQNFLRPLKDVTKATQKSVLILFGGERKPLLALGISTLLGALAGCGEEMLFRGVLMSQLSENFGNWIALSVSAIIFGALHAVTPLYAIIATVIGFYFGELYLTFNNLAVPIICHGFYDILALLWTHYEVTGMTYDERRALIPSE